ncbi:MAG: Rrf2 family transcriptional regulator [Rhodospirillaceae bacterium]|nr:Rrf2 family transcriptional regulator [Rhodospirillaceae bacterium]
MFRPTRKLLFAVEAVLDIAYNGAQLPVQSSEITRRQGIPRRYLEQVLQQLVRERILSGVRGPRGGYRLARERRRVTVGEIVRVVTMMEMPAETADGDDGSSLGRDIVRPLFGELHDRVMAELDSITLDDLCRQAQAAGIAREDDPLEADYTI